MALALFGNVVRGLKTLDLSIYPSPYFAKALELSLISALLGYLVATAVVEFGPNLTHAVHEDFGVPLTGDVKLASLNSALLGYLAATVVVEFGPKLIACSV